MFSTTWGICVSLKANLNSLKTSGSGTVVAQITLDELFETPIPNWLEDPVSVFAKVFLPLLAGEGAEEAAGK
jgi:hypothetical protein